MPKDIRDTQRNCRNRCSGLDVHHCAANSDNDEWFMVDIFDGSFGLLSMLSALATFQPNLRVTMTVGERPAAPRAPADRQAKSSN
jgi:hypothetical protein